MALPGFSLLPHISESPTLRWKLKDTQHTEERVRIFSRYFLSWLHSNYKDRKCAVNENPSVRIESAGSKTCDNRPLKNGSAVSNCSIVCW